MSELLFDLCLILKYSLHHFFSTDSLGARNEQTSEKEITHAMLQKLVNLE